MARAKGIKPMAQNKKAFHDYFVEERLECGMELKGTEVKSMRQGRMNLKESFAIVQRRRGSGLDGMHISPYEQGNHVQPRSPASTSGCCCTRARSASSDRLVRQDRAIRSSRFPVYLKDGRIKLELGLCKGKQLHDKRDDMAAKDAQRDIQRAFRDAQKR